jgi:hypothetical protein
LKFDIEILYIIDDDMFNDVKTSTFANIDKRLNKSTKKGNDDVEPKSPSKFQESKEGLPFDLQPSSVKIGPTLEIIGSASKETSHKHAHRKGLKECKICQNLI